MTGISEMESKVQRILDEAKQARPTIKRIQACHAFSARWSHAVTLQQVNRLAGALYDLEGDADLSDELESMVEAGILSASGKGKSRKYQLRA